MTKKELEKKFEEKFEELERRIAELERRIATLEARPVYNPYTIQPPSPRYGTWYS